MQSKTLVLGKHPKIPTGRLAFRCWEHLRDNPRQSAKEIADMLKLPRTNTAALLSEMEKKGQLTTTLVTNEISERAYRLYEVAL